MSKKTTDPKTNTSDVDVHWLHCGVSCDWIEHWTNRCLIYDTHQSSDMAVVFYPRAYKNTSYVVDWTRTVQCRPNDVIKSVDKFLLYLPINPVRQVNRSSWTMERSLLFCVTNWVDRKLARSPGCGKLKHFNAFCYTRAYNGGCTSAIQLRSSRSVTEPHAASEPRGQELAIVGMAGRRNRPPQLSTRYDDDDDDQHHES